MIRRLSTLFAAAFLVAMSFVTPAQAQQGQTLPAGLSFPLAASAPAHVLFHLLEALPLFGREHLLEALVRLPADVVHARLGGAARFVHLFARVGEYLAHARLLLGGELRLRPRRSSIVQPSQAFGVVAMHPIAQDLPVHPA